MEKHRWDNQAFEPDIHGEVQNVLSAIALLVAAACVAGAYGLLREALSDVW